MRKGFQKRRAAHWYAIFVPGQDGGEVEAKTIDVVDAHPVTQTIQDEVSHYRVVAVHRVATTTEVEIEPIGGQQVVGRVVYAPEGDVLAVLVALRRVIEDDVKYDLYARLVKALNYILELFCGDAIG